MSSLQSRVIAITGSASGIGLATAHLLASHGAILCLADLNGPLLETAEREIKQKFPAVAILTCVLDVRKEEDVKRWIEGIVGVHGRLDGAVNLAGVIGKSIGVHGVQDLDVDEWDFILDVNLKGVMLCLKHELKAMCKEEGGKGRGGSVVNASSIAGVMGMANNAAYTASKHAVIGLTRSAAKEVGSRGIRVNAICPGFIDTPMQTQSKEIQEAAGKGPGTAEKRKKAIESVALGRGGTAQECAELIVFLLGDGAGFMTGNAVSVDGGWNC